MDLRKLLRSSDFVSSVYYGLRLDSLQVLLGVGSYKRACEAAIEKYARGQVGGG